MAPENSMARDYIPESRILSIGRPGDFALRQKHFVLARAWGAAAGAAGSDCPLASARDQRPVRNAQRAAPREVSSRVVSAIGVPTAAAEVVRDRLLPSVAPLRE